MVKTFDPKKVNIIIGASFLTGYADGRFITTKRASDMWNKKVGASGEVARAKSNDLSGEIEIVLLQSSSSNDILSALATLDELTNTGIVPLLIQDMSGTTLAAAKSCWVKKKPDSEMSKEVGERTWILDTDELEYFIGGNKGN